MMMRQLVSLALALIVVGAGVATAGNGVMIINDPDTLWSYTNLPPDDREELLIQEERAQTARRAANRESFPHKELVAIVSEAALRHGIEPELLCAIAWTESRFRPYVVSPMGAQGLMQFMPATGRKFGIRNPGNPMESAEGGARYMRYLLKEYDGNLSLALAAYNAGPGAVKKGGSVPPFSETMNFVKSVLTMRDYFRNK
jgi:soluble lytic murein transglycosylase-like protein